MGLIRTATRDPRACFTPGIEPFVGIEFEAAALQKEHLDLLHVVSEPDRDRFAVMHTEVLPRMRNTLRGRISRTNYVLPDSSKYCWSAQAG